MRTKRVTLLSAMGVLVALVFAGSARSRNCPTKLHSLSVEPSGLFDQAGAELPFVKLALSVPALEQPGVELARQPVKVECKAKSRWVAVPNTSILSAATNGEISFVVLPGTEMCRLRFPCRREVPGARMVKCILPPARFWRLCPSLTDWIWHRSPVGPTLIRLHGHRNESENPVYDTEVAIEILLPP